jgi:dihydroorotate dehydrogenase (fumarate)
LGANISNPVALADSLYARGAKGVVLFNRFYPTDIDIDKMSFTMSSPFTTSSDLSQSIRWAGIITASVPQLPVAVSGGVESYKGIVKSILSGASAVEVASAIMKNGAGWITQANEALATWQKEKGYGTINEYKGKMNAADPENADRLMRTQFLKYFSEIH